jgi:hypothetical protein
LSYGQYSNVTELFVSLVREQVSSVERPQLIGKEKTCGQENDPLTVVWMETMTPGAAGRKKIYLH